MNVEKLLELAHESSKLLMSKCTVKHDHAPVRLMTQQLLFLVVQTGLTNRDNRSDRYLYGEDQRVDAKIKITITLSW
jgi:hypothetical protein